jgi:hypothetical protein
MAHEHSPLRWTAVCIDCADAEELAYFYSQLLGWVVSARDGQDWLQLGNPEGGVGLNIQAEESYRRPLIAPSTPADRSLPTSRRIAIQTKFGSCSTPPATRSASSRQANSAARPVLAQPCHTPRIGLTHGVLGGDSCWQRLFD